MRTTDEIYAALRADLISAGGPAPAEGGDLSLRLRAVAAEILTLEAQAEFVTRQCFPQTATGEYLDRHAALRGLARGEPQKAAGALRFYLEQAADSPVVVPAGTECLTAAGDAFVTTSAGTIPAGSLWCEVSAEAVESGSAGNAPADAITYMRLAPVAVSGVTNTEAFSGGTDGEDDAALRARVLSSYRTLPNGANSGYYESKVLEFDNVAAVTVVPRARGVGTVNVIFSTLRGVPTAEEVEAVREVLDREREICVDLRVLAPTAVTVDVAGTLEIAEGRSFSAVNTAAQAALEAFFDGKRLSKPVYLAELCAVLMAVEGVVNVTLSAPAADRPATDGILPRLGTVSFSEAV